MQVASSSRHRGAADSGSSIGGPFDSKHSITDVRSIAECADVAAVGVQNASRHWREPMLA
jgi:hypothetical protein